MYSTLLAASSLRLDVEDNATKDSGEIILPVSGLPPRWNCTSKLAMDFVPLLERSKALFMCGEI